MERLEDEKIDLIRFKFSVNNIKEKITNFRDDNRKLTEQNLKSKLFSTILKSTDFVVIFATTVTSLTLSVTGIDLIVIPLSIGCACIMTIISFSVEHKKFMQKDKRRKKHYKRAQDLKKLPTVFIKCIQNFC